MLADGFVLAASDDGQLMTGVVAEVPLQIARLVALAGSPRRLATIGGAGGIVMIGLGAGLAATGRGD